METFEKHITNILNKWARENQKYGEFFFVRRYKTGVLKLYKDFTIDLWFRSPFESKSVWETKASLPIKTSEIEQGYEAILEEMLYKLLTDRELWSSISTRLP